jgi:hypothetical protein
VPASENLRKTRRLLCYRNVRFRQLQTYRGARAGRQWATTGHHRGTAIRIALVRSGEARQ